MSARTCRQNSFRCEPFKYMLPSPSDELCYRYDSRALYTKSLASYLLESTSAPNLEGGEILSGRSGPSSLPRERTGSGRSGVPSMAVRRLRFALTKGGRDGRSPALPSMQALRTAPHALARRSTPAARAPIPCNKIKAN
eukprot:6173247-Pleurochrysis_carterae.AAC.2